MKILSVRYLFIIPENCANRTEKERLGRYMFTKRIIPCLDVNNGRVVKGVNFVDLKDAGDPVTVGAAYGKAGADELVFLDITGSSDARATKIDMVRELQKQYLYHLLSVAE